MQRHLDKFKVEVVRSSYEFRQNTQDPAYCKIFSIQMDEAFIKGVKSLIRRLFMNDEGAGNFRSVGWVINCDIESCMICGYALTSLFKHHCKACGNIVCESCSSSTALIVGLEDCNELRVCDMCFWGQVQRAVKIHTMYLIENIKYHFYI